MSSNVILPRDFDISNLTYGEMKRMDNGGKMVSVGYNGQPLILQTCECYAPFGVACYQNDDGKAPSYALNLSFKNIDTRKSLQQLHDLFSKLDERNVQMGMENATTWLSQKKQPKSTEVVEALYTPTIVVAKDDRYPSTFKFKIPTKNGRPACDVYDKNNQQIDLMELINGDTNRTKGAKCTAIIQCTGIWLAGSKFGMSWKCVQLKCCARENFSGFCIRSVPEDSIEGDDIDEEAPVVESNPIKKPAPRADPKPEERDGENHDDDYEDEDEEDDDEVPVPVISRKNKVKISKREHAPYQDGEGDEH